MRRGKKHNVMQTTYLRHDGEPVIEPKRLGDPTAAVNSEYGCDAGQHHERPRVSRNLRSSGFHHDESVGGWMRGERDAGKREGKKTTKQTTFLRIATGFVRTGTQKMEGNSSAMVTHRARNLLYRKAREKIFAVYDNYSSGHPPKALVPTIACATGRDRARRRLLAPQAAYYPGLAKTKPGIVIVVVLLGSGLCPPFAQGSRGASRASSPCRAT